MFSQIAVDPSEACWKGEINIVGDDLFANRLIGVLTSGCAGFGKTKATLTGTPFDELPEPTALTTQTCIVSVQTPCTLFPIENSDADLRHLYSSYFESHGLALTAFMARQSLRSRYQALRFKADNERFRPWVMTDPGSVFQLELRSDEAREVVRIWLKDGLPPHSDWSIDWRAMPFLPQQGYGKIALEPTEFSLPEPTAK